MHWSSRQSAKKQCSSCPCLEVQIAANIRPTLQSMGQTTSKYTSGAQASASDFYAKSRDYTSKSWSAYEPHISRLSSDWKVSRQLPAFTSWAGHPLHIL